MIHAVLAKQAGRHESSCTINVMCTKAQRKRIQAYVHKGKEDKDQIMRTKAERTRIKLMCIKTKRTRTKLMCKKENERTYLHEGIKDKDQA